jgi:predicted DNA-binding ribbon-helix-helix protein
MSTLSVRLPKSVHKQLKDLAKKEGVSLNQLINSAVAEKMSALMTVEYLEKRGQLASRDKFESVLSKVAAENPEEYDAL